jgi:(S)-mandelate dehydrogenase
LNDNLMQERPTAERRPAPEPTSPSHHAAIGAPVSSLKGGAGMRSSFLFAAGATLGAAAALAFAGGRRGTAIADKTLAGASPAVLRGTPRRRFRRFGDVSRAVTVEDLRAMAHRRLPDFALEYLEGGAEDEAAIARNIAAWAHWRLTHRSLVNVERRDLSRSLFGQSMAIPVAVAPTGLNGVFWPHADLRLAEAAAEAGVPFAQSTMSNDRMERVARVPGLRYWWQLYVFGPTEVGNRLIDRARDAGCEALIVTVDAQIFGNREWYERHTSGPNALDWGTRFDALRHPRWLTTGILSHGMPRFENVIEFLPEDKRGLFASAHWIRSQMDLALTWDTIARIRERWPRRLIIKGLLDVVDMVRAAEIGADAVAISNHGGRQLDWTVAPIELLPAARKAVGDRIAIIVDGGIRRGTDVIKALALGADAVFAGRAVLYGVAAGGRAGAKRSLDILREELDRDLGLLGVRSLTELDPTFLAPGLG